MRLSLEPVIAYIEETGEPGGDAVEIGDPAGVFLRGVGEDGHGEGDLFYRMLDGSILGQVGSEIAGVYLIEEIFIVLKAVYLAQPLKGGPVSGKVAAAGEEGFLLGDSQVPGCVLIDQPGKLPRHS